MTITRLEKLIASLRTSGLDAVALNPGPTLTYLTGAYFHLMERPIVLLVAREATPAIILPKMEMQKVEQMPYHVQAFPYGENPSEWEAVFRKAAKALGLDGKHIGVEPNRMRLLEFRYVKAGAPEADYPDAGKFAVANGIRYMLDNKPVDNSKVILFCTDLCVRMTDSIPSGGSGVIELAWNFQIPSSNSELSRMGRYDGNFFLGLWYPQIAVHDDIKGWDNNPQLGIKEFYNDFSNYDVTIHAPDGYMVWATGECGTYDSVLDGKIIEKLNFARNHDSIVSIIAPGDRKEYQKNNPGRQTGS
jgi:hypothetical protein